MTRFQGFVFDIDDTAIPTGALTVESQTLRSAFRALPSNIVAIAATGRDLDSALPITRMLGLKHESIVANGALIVNSLTGKTMYEQFLSVEQARAVLAICQDYPAYRVQLIGDAPQDGQSVSPTRTAGLFIFDVPLNEAQTISARLAAISDVYVYLSGAWSGRPDAFDINIGHAKARKHIALERLFAMHAIDPSKMIAIGDGANDIDLFNAVGYRIATANAHPNLLKYADEVIGSPDDDGLAQMIKKFFIA